MFKKYGSLETGAKFTGRRTGNTLLKTDRPGVAVILALGSKNSKGRVGKTVEVSASTDVIGCSC